MRKAYGIMGILAVGAAIWAGGAIAQNNQNHENIGQHFQFMASNLPPPYATPASAERSTKAQDPDLGKLQLPPGFKANLFADGLTDARWLQMAPNGDVMLAEAEAGRSPAARHEWRRQSRYAGPSPTASSGPTAWPSRTANSTSPTLGHLQFPYKDGDTKARVRAPRSPNRALRQARRPLDTQSRGRSKGTLYVAIGSNGNINDSDDPWRAAVLNRPRQQASNTGPAAQSGRHQILSGTDDLYVVVNERDGEGDELVPDYLTPGSEGRFLRLALGLSRQSRRTVAERQAPELVAKAKVPDVLFRSHSAPLGLLFYTGTQFPAQYRGGAFVAHHGSWNASNPRG